MVLFSTYRGLPKEATWIIYSLLIPSVAFGMLYTDISYFLTLQGLSDVNMGVIVMVMGISTFTTSIPLGMVADRYGKKKVLILGNLAASITIAVFALTANFAILLFAAILEGLGEGASSAATSALLAEKCEARQRNSVFSLFGFAQSMAWGAGGFAVPAVLIFQVLGFNENLSHVILYVIVAIVSLASTVLMLRIKESNIRNKPMAGTKFSVKSIFPRKSRDVLLKYVITGSTIAFGAGLFVPLMTRWMYSMYGVVDTLSSTVLAVASIAIAFATLASPLIAKKIGLIKAVVVTQSSSTLFMFLVPFSPSFMLASVVYSVRAFLMNMSSPLEQSMIMGLVDKDERGAASGISTALWRLPNSLSSAVGAWMMGIGLLTLPFFLATVIYIFSIGLFWFFFKNTRMPEEMPEFERQVDIERD